jgi:hypothetical protein
VELVGYFVRQLVGWLDRHLFIHLVGSLYRHIFVIRQLISLVGLLDS